jgi:hypothetical protein
LRSCAKPWGRFIFFEYCGGHRGFYLTGFYLTGFTDREYQELQAINARGLLVFLGRCLAGFARIASNDFLVSGWIALRLSQIDNCRHGRRYCNLRM